MRAYLALLAVAVACAVASGPTCQMITVYETSSGGSSSSGHTWYTELWNADLTTSNKFTLNHTYEHIAYGIEGFFYNSSTAFIMGISQIDSQYYTNYVGYVLDLKSGALQYKFDMSDKFSFFGTEVVLHTAADVYSNVYWPVQAINASNCIEFHMFNVSTNTTHTFHERCLELTSNLIGMIPVGKTAWPSAWMSIQTKDNNGNFKYIQSRMITWGDAASGFAVKYNVSLNIIPVIKLDAQIFDLIYTDTATGDGLVLVGAFDTNTNVTTFLLYSANFYEDSSMTLLGSMNGTAGFQPFAFYNDGTQYWIQSSIPMLGPGPDSMGYTTIMNDGSSGSNYGPFAYDDTDNTLLIFGVAPYCW